MSQLDAFVTAVTQQTRAAFENAHGYPFLMLQMPETTAKPDEWSFQTRTVVSPRAGQGRALLAAGAERYRVFALIKQASNPWPERISLGRARNNDVVLPDNSVSKLHAHYTKDKDDRMFIIDAGSRNGTVVNGKRLASNERAEVKFEDTIIIGVLQLVLVTSGMVYDLVHSQLDNA
jgi:hypothetical protein